MTENVQISRGAYAVPDTELKDKARIGVDAGLGRRFFNLLFDTLAILVISEFLLPIVWLFLVDGRELAAVDMFYMELTPDFLPFVLIIYYVLFEWLTGRTPGKVVTSTYVVNQDGHSPGFWPTVARSCVRLVPFELVSIYFSANRRSWHDLVSRTQVVVRI